MNLIGCLANFKFKPTCSREWEFAPGCTRLNGAFNECRYYALYDTTGRLSAEILRENQVPAEIIKEIGAYDSPYSLLIYKCWSGETTQFETALMDLSKKMHEKGYVDCPERCAKEADQLCRTLNQLAKHNWFWKG